MATIPNGMTTGSGDAQEHESDPWEELERWKRWCADARLMRDALQRENDQLRDKIKALFDASCEAKHECDGVSHKAFDILHRALRAAA